MNYVKLLEAQNETLQSLLSQSQEEAEHLRKELKETNSFKYFFEVYSESTNQSILRDTYTTIEKTIKCIKERFNSQQTLFFESNPDFTLYVDFIYFRDDQQYLPLRIFDLEIKEKLIKNFTKFKGPWSKLKNNGIDFQPIKTTITKLVKESPY